MGAWVLLNDNSNAQNNLSLNCNCDEDQEGKEQAYTHTQDIRDGIAYIINLSGEIWIPDR